MTIFRGCFCYVHFVSLLFLIHYSRKHNIIIKEFLQDNYTDLATLNFFSRALSTGSVSKLSSIMLLLCHFTFFLFLFQDLMKLFARLAEENVGFIDWTQYIPKVCNFYH